MTAEYKNTQAQIVKNSKALCEELKKLNIPVVYGTSETHIVLVDCSKYGTGKEVANKYKEQFPKFPQKLYDAMMNYEVFEND